MKKILVPTDFSPNANKALNYAVQIAKQSNSELYLIHAADLPSYPESAQTEKEAESFRAIIKELTDRLETLGKSISNTEPIGIGTRLYSGTPTEAILQAIDDLSIDLIVLGTVGNSGVKEKIYGSKTAEVIGKSTIPVLVIPLLGEWVIPRKILVTINNFDTRREILKPVFDLARMFVASIQVAVFTDTDDDYVEDYAIDETKIAQFRDQLKVYYDEVEVHAVHLAGHHFLESLQNWIDKNSIDIIVMLTHKRTILGSIFNRSKTKKMSYQTNIPLLAIPV